MQPSQRQSLSPSGRENVAYHCYRRLSRTGQANARIHLRFVFRGLSDKTVGKKSKKIAADSGAMNGNGKAPRRTKSTAGPKKSASRSGAPIRKAKAARGHSA